MALSTHAILFVPSKPAQSWSHKYYSSFMMECSCAHPILWFSGSDIAQCMTGNSDCINHLMFYNQVFSLSGPSSKPEVAFQIESICCLKTKWPYSKTLAIYCVILLLGLARDFTKSLLASNMPALLGLVGHKAQVAWQLR